MPGTFIHSPSVPQRRVFHQLGSTLLEQTTMSAPSQTTSRADSAKLIHCGRITTSDVGPQERFIDADEASTTQLSIVRPAPLVVNNLEGDSPRLAICCYDFFTLIHPFRSSSPHKPHLGPVDADTYFIINARTGSYAVQTSETDRLEIVTANEKGTHGSQVNNPSFKSGNCWALQITKWAIGFVKRDEYKIYNSEFKYFASYDNRPGAGEFVLSKQTCSSLWRIRPTPGSKMHYT
jgi:hypothetical protein